MTHGSVFLQNGITHGSAFLRNRITDGSRFLQDCRNSFAAQQLWHAFKKVPHTIFFLHMSGDLSAHYL